MSYSYINSNKTNSGTKNEKNKIIKQLASNTKKCFQNLNHPIKILRTKN